ncbi:MAG: glycosyl transferase family 2 [uncultured bacterium]|nr:MAG: glycosyl transferase family 2 [uncultured bacterium]
MKIDIIVPVFNESSFIKSFLDDLFKEKKSLKFIRNIIIVDDGSTDETILNIKKSKKIEIITYKKNHGKGYAMRIGINMAKKSKADAVIFMDGDRQHNPKHLSEFIKSLEKHELVFGYRQLTKDTPYFRKIGNKIVRYLLQTFFNIKRHDVLCGFMALRKEIFDKIIWESNDYGVEIEISAIVGKKKIPFKEILIDTLYLDIKKGVTLTKAFFISLKIPYWYFRYK